MFVKPWKWDSNLKEVEFGNMSEVAEYMDVIDMYIPVISSWWLWDSLVNSQLKSPARERQSKLSLVILTNSARLVLPYNAQRIFAKQVGQLPLETFFKNS